MTGPDVTLFSDSRYNSPWVLTVWAALGEKGIPFAVETLDLRTGEHRRGDYPERTLTAKVPALRHGNVYIAESLAILEYLEEAFGPPRLYPAYLADRARDRQILSWLRTDLIELRKCMPFEGVMGAHDAPEITPRAESDAGKLLRIAATRNLGAAPTLADFELAFALRRLVRYRPELLTSELRAYSDAIWNRPSVQSWATLPRPAAG